MDNINQWLDGLGLGQYASLFAENDIDAMVLSELTDADLKELGLSIGHRRKLLKAIAALRSEQVFEAPLDDRSLDASRLPPAIPSDAERRQLTVMFCDLVGSTELSVRFDPEDLREIIAEYHAYCERVINRFEGYIARYMGDGVLVYYGYPRAHEDVAEHAIRAGLEIVAGVEELKLRPDLQLQTRVGIATGEVVVGDVLGEGPSREEVVVGQTPNLAARLNALAQPGELVISDATHQLTRGLFDYVDLGRHRLKGFTAPARAWRVIGVRSVESRFEATHEMTELTPLVGREGEIALLIEKWHQATTGEGQAVMVLGEPGIGKSRLGQALREYVSGQPHTLLRYFCSQYHQNSVLYPVIAQLERAARISEHDAAPVKLEKLEDMLALATDNVADVGSLMAALLSIPVDDRYPESTMDPQRQRALTMEALEAQLVGLAARQPVLAIFEDLHWSDPSTLELLERLVERISALPVVILMACRPGAASQWMAGLGVTTVSLNRLSRNKCVEIVNELTHGKALPAELLEQITAGTDGMPLFIEELTKNVLEAGILSDAGDRYVLNGPLPPLAVPSTLQDSLMARLDRLSSVKDVAQIAACIGRQFPYELLEAVAALDGSKLEDALDQLVRAELIYCRGTPPTATYSFKHALVQDAAHNTLLRSKRRQLHARIASVLEEQFPNAVESDPDVLAWHFSEAGMAEKAIAYWKSAGRRALQRSANMEAVRHLSMAIEELKKLNGTGEQDREEIALQIALGGALIATRGFGAEETARAYTRARELCEVAGDDVQLFPALYGQWLHEFAGPTDLDKAQEIARRIHDLADDSGDPGPQLIGHRVLGTTLLMRGELSDALKHLDQTLALYDGQNHRALAFHYGQDPWVASQAVGRSWCLWLMGYPQAAQDAARSAVGRARELGHVNSIAFAEWAFGRLEVFRGDAQAIRRQADTVVTLAREQGLSLWLAWGTILQGWALTLEGNPQEGIRYLLSGLNLPQSESNHIHRPYHMLLLVKAYANAGETGQALRLLADIMTLIDESKERFAEAELKRVKGELTFKLGGDGAAAAAESCLLESLDISRAQGAKAWELRAATSLARLWAHQGKDREALEILRPVHGWYAQDLDTEDLREAKRVLDSLM